MQMNAIRWGILGCGDVTEVKSGPALSKVPNSSLVAVMRRDGDKAADYAKRHGVPLWYDSVDALIADAEVNAVYIATPPGSHCELALKVAAAGKPCYVEKPMARNSEECQRMVQAFETARLPLFVAYYRRGLPHFTYIKTLIESGQFGALLSLNYRYANGQQRNGSAPDSWRFQPETSGGGLFWDLGSHALDLFDWWLGPLGSVQGHLITRSQESPVEELVAMTAVAGAAVSVAADWNFISTQARDDVTLEFERARVTCSVFGSTDVCIQSADAMQDVIKRPHSEHIQFDLITNIVDSLRTGAPALSTGITAARTNHVMDQIAMRTHGSNTKLSRPPWAFRLA
jgi:predicted dehydrogenase